MGRIEAVDLDEAKDRARKGLWHWRASLFSFDKSVEDREAHEVEAQFQFDKIRQMRELPPFEVALSQIQARREEKLDAWDIVIS